MCGDRIVEINLVQCDWLCWLCYGKAKLALCVLSIERRERKRKSRAQAWQWRPIHTATASHLLPALFQLTESVVREGGTVRCETGSSFVNDLIVYGKDFPTRSPIDAREGC